MREGGCWNRQVYGVNRINGKCRSCHKKDELGRALLWSKWDISPQGWNHIQSRREGRTFEWPSMLQADRSWERRRSDPGLAFDQRYD